MFKILMLLLSTQNIFSHSKNDSKVRLMLKLMIKYVGSSEFLTSFWVLDQHMWLRFFQEILYVLWFVNVQRTYLSDIIQKNSL